MTPLEVKIFMWENGLTPSLMARQMADENTKEASLRVMISDMIYQRRFYPTLAAKIKDKYNLNLTRGERLLSAREITQIRKAA
jgi:hypothetical protein